MMNKLKFAAALMTVATTLLVQTALAGDKPAKTALPRLVDLGADKCIPCKKMAPILEELKKEYSGRMDVEFIDVWKNEKAAKEYKIKLIPTQIFYRADGKELFRHEGFFGKEDILAKWKELGVSIATSPSAAPAPTGTNTTTTSK